MKHSDPVKVLCMLPSMGAGGAERILITLMNNLDRKKFSPEFLTLSDEGPIKDWIADDIPFHTFGNKTIKSSIFKLIALIRKRNPDILFTTMAHSNALALLMKFFFPKLKVVVREAALPSVLVSRYGIKGRSCILIYKLLYKHADLVISNCSQMIHDFNHVIKIKTHNHRVLFNPVDTDRIFKNISEISDIKPRQTGVIRFVSVGRLSFEKGYDRLIKELKTFKPTDNWRLDIIGEGPYQSTLEDLIEENALQNHVHLRGYLSNPWRYAAHADCLLLPSRWEGMPNVVLEGFAYGIPAIATRESGGILDIQKHIDSDGLKIAENMQVFVEHMHDIKMNAKKSNGKSILPNAFLLPHVMKKFQTLLYDVVKS